MPKAAKGSRITNGARKYGLFSQNKPKENQNLALVAE
jgi:hypothetical protein